MRELIFSKTKSPFQIAHFTVIRYKVLYQNVNLPLDLKRDEMPFVCRYLAHEELNQISPIMSYQVKEGGQDSSSFSLLKKIYLNIGNSNTPMIRIDMTGLAV